MSSPPNKLSVVVVGAGVAGLSVALCLAQKGHHVRVLERQEQLSLNGGIILLPPSATRILADLGVLQDLQRITDEIPVMCIRRYENSEFLQRRPPPSVFTFP
jgi:salicylate hydroxylase